MTSFAIIKFPDKEEEEKALVKQRYLIDGRECILKIPARAMLADLSERKVFVSYHHDSLSHNELRKHFEKFGKVEEVFISTPWRHFAFVTFRSAAVAQSLVDKEHEINGIGLVTKKWRSRELEPKMERWQGREEEKTGNKWGREVEQRLGNKWGSREEEERRREWRESSVRREARENRKEWREVSLRREDKEEERQWKEEGRKVWWESPVRREVKKEGTEWWESSEDGENKENKEDKENKENKEEGESKRIRILEETTELIQGVDHFINIKKEPQA